MYLELLAECVDIWWPLYRQKWVIGTKNVFTKWALRADRRWGDDGKVGSIKLALQYGTTL